jgi:hypothetical protein
MNPLPFFPSIAGAALLLIDPSEPQYAVWGMLITTVGATVASMITRINDRKDAKQKHDFEIEALKLAAIQRKALADAVAENTELTKHGIVATAAFADTANHVNEKISKLAGPSTFALFSSVVGPTVVEAPAPRKEDPSGEGGLG